MKKTNYQENLRWQLMENAFEGITTPDAFLIGHAFMSPKTTISRELWENFSQFCDLCDTIADLRMQGLDKESCLSAWMSYEVRGFTSASPTSKEEMELPLNPIPSQNDNKDNNGSETKPSSRGI